MDKDKKLFLSIILVLLAFMVSIGIITFKDKKDPVASVNTDAMIFKNEYEALNNVLNESNGKNIKELNIKENNPVDILTEEETIDLLENKTGILYLGFPDCPWCRSMLPVLLQTLENMNIDRLYYLNIKDIRDTFTLDDNNKAIKTKDGSESYYKMLDILDDNLEKYYLTTDKGKKVDTKEKRILAPTIIGIKEGKIVGVHVATVDSQTDPYEDLTNEQQEELANIYMNLIEKVYNVDCDEAC